MRGTKQSEFLLSSSLSCTYVILLSLILQFPGLFPNFSSLVWLFMWTLWNKNYFFAVSILDMNKVTMQFFLMMKSHTIGMQSFSIFTIRGHLLHNWILATTMQWHMIWKQWDENDMDPKAPHWIDKTVRSLKSTVSSFTTVQHFALGVCDKEPNLLWKCIIVAFVP
jgi:hypothetical protein